MTTNDTQAPADKVGRSVNRKGGRKPGVPNKATADVRAAMALICQKSVGKFLSWMEDIEDPAARCNVFLRLAEFHIPKLNRTIFTGGEANEPVRILVEGVKSLHAGQGTVP